MPDERIVGFGAFRFDPANARLWRDHEPLRVSPKALAVLHCLVEHSGQLVTKEELFRNVWPGVVVGDAALTICIGELRKVLGESAKAPRFIETVHKRGYRFIAAVTAAPVSSSTFQVSRQNNEPLKTRNQKLETPLVGREADLAQLHQLLGKALQGERQLVFVTGEPGIGKTTLIEAFRQRLEAGGWRLVPSPQASSLQPLASPVSFAHGQCIEHHGAGEAYMPILEALGRLCRAPGGDHLLRLLSQSAPTWLAQLPTLLSADELAALQPKVQGATQGRMLRELAEALEALTAERPLVLVLEDLHWSDASTVDLLAALARRRESARLLVLGTYRPVEVLGNGHPLNSMLQELQAHTLCAEVGLGVLTPADIAAYLRLRFPESVFPTDLAHSLWQRTSGNPLFLVNIVDDLVARGILLQVDGGWVLQGGLEAVEGGVPKSIRQLLARQSARLLPAEQRVLEAASLAGMEFSAAAVAAALEEPTITVEEQCARLVHRQHFLRAAGLSEWPDGTLAARYGFQHALYQQLWHERVSPSRLQQFHLRIGERQEAAYGNRAHEIAAELAVHFEQGRKYQRAIHYLQYAAQTASGRSANTEAIQHLTKALELLKTLPDTSERIRQELDLQTALGTMFMAIKGYGALEVENSYTRAQELSRGIEEAPRLASLFYGLWVFHLVRGELKTAYEVAQQFMRLAQRVQDSTLLMEAHHAFGQILHCMGDFPSALAHLEKNLALYNPQQHSPAVRRNVQDLGVMGRCYAAWSLWYLGYPDQALRRVAEARTLAQELAHPFSLVFALNTSARLHAERCEWLAAQAQAERVIACATEQGFSLFVGLGAMHRSWALAEQGDGDGEERIVQLRQGLASYRAAGAELGRPSILFWLANEYGKGGQPEEGLSLLTEALTVVNTTEERSYEAELYRLKGELTLQQESKEQGAKIETDPRPPTPNPQGEAEACFLKALKISRQQQAKSLELRAVMSLARLRQLQVAHDGSRTTQHEARAKLDEAHQMLSTIYNWFTEGFDTKDLQEAKALLEKLHG